VSAPQPVICLASASPRRRELLAQIGIVPVVVAAHIDESWHARESPEDYVQRMARAKAAHVWADRAARRDLPVLAADTSVVLGARIFGKPRDRGDALAMLEALSDREHRVLSGVALASAHGLSVRLSESAVRLRAISAAERDSYWASGEPLDKAGAYAVQGRGAIFIAQLRGSYSGVMGLPLYETAQLLREAGIACAV
jgi:septum formation protein